VSQTDWILLLGILAVVLLLILLFTRRL